VVRCCSAGFAFSLISFHRKIQQVHLLNYKSKTLLGDGEKYRELLILGGLFGTKQRRKSVDVAQINLWRGLSGEVGLEV